MLKILYNSVEMQDLFKDNNHKAIQLNIEKLKNAAKFASGFFKNLGSITKEEQSLLDNLSEATLFKARTLLDQNYDILKSMFTELPPFDIMKDKVENMTEPFYSKIRKDLQNKASSSEGESTDSGNESTDEEPRNSQNEDKIEDDSPEGKDDESSKTENGIGAENKETTI
jgi:hypothetical protein